MLHRATLWDNGTIWCSQTILPWCAVLWWRYAEKRAQQPAMASDPGPRVMMEPSGHNPVVYGSEMRMHGHPAVKAQRGTHESTGAVPGRSNWWSQLCSECTRAPDMNLFRTA